MCVCAYTNVCRCPQRPEEGAGSLRAVVTDIYELRTKLHSSARTEKLLNC